MAQHPTTPTVTRRQTGGGDITQAPGVGNFIQPQPTPNVPPANPQEEATLTQKWLEFIQNPQVQAGLLQFSINALQPAAPGRGTAAHLAAAVAGGGQAVGRVRAAEREEGKEGFRRRGVLEGEKIEREKLSAAEVRQRIASEASLESAVIGAESRRDVAGIGAKAATGVAGIGATSRERVADITLGGTLGAAKTGAESRERVAGIGAKARLGAAEISAGATTTAAETAAAARKEAAGISAGATVEAAKIRSVPEKVRPLTSEEKKALNIGEGFLAQLNTSTNEITVKDLSGKTTVLKPVLDRKATKAAGAPVTSYATPAVIEASKGNLVPPPSGIRLRTTKEGVEFATGGLDLPPATETRARARITAGVELLTNVGTLLDQVERGGAAVIGPLGFFKGLINVTLASFVPVMFSKDRALFERQLKIVREASKRAVSDEERFTDEDREFVQELFPTPGLFGNPQVADAKLQVMAAFFIRRLGPDLEAVGVDTAQVPTLELGDLLRMGGAQLLTTVEVRSSAEFLFPGQALDLDSALSALVKADVPMEEMDTIIRQLFPGVLQ